MVLTKVGGVEPLHRNRVSAKMWSRVNPIIKMAIVDFGMELNISGGQRGSMSHSYRLLVEMATWFNNLLLQGKSPRKAFSGYKNNGGQFVCILSDLGLERGDDLDFMHLVIKTEDCLAFAFSLHLGTLDQKEEYVFISGQEDEYWYVSFEPSSAGLKPLKSYKTETPSVFYQEILTRKLYDTDNSEILLRVWGDIRERIFWRYDQLAQSTD